MEQAVKSKFQPVCVYSDSPEIREIAKACGALTPLRPESVSGDETTSEATMSAFIDEFDPKNRHEAFALIQCTTPFLNAEHLNSVYAEFGTKKYDSVVTVSVMDRFLGYPEMKGDSRFLPVRPYRQLRQNCSWVMYMENGGCYLATRELWKSGRRIGLRCGIVAMGWWEGLEIDEPLDLEVARRIAPLFMEGENGQEETTQTGDGNAVQKTDEKTGG